MKQRNLMQLAGQHGALVLLTLGYAVSTVDRYVLAILQEPIKKELHLSDSELGLLTGFGFALFYSVFAIPIGYLADRWSRRNLLAIVMVLWSLMTALTAAAHSFTFLLICRIGVAVGEAGLVPASASLIGARYHSRYLASAMSFLYTGPSLGLLVAFLCGSRLAQWVGWRETFVIVAAPGIITALILLMSITEERRPVHGTPLRLLEGLQHLRSLPTLRPYAVAVCLSVLVATAPMSWAAPYLIRSHAMSLVEVGFILALAFGAGGAIANFGSGLIVDHLVRRDVRWYLWFPAVLMSIIFPMIAGSMLVQNDSLAVVLLAVPCMLGVSFAGVAVALLNRLSPEHFRGATTALYILTVNIFGVGVGTWLVGIVSDLLASRAHADSLKYALLLIVPGSAVIALCAYLLAARHLRSDLQRSTSNMAASAAPATDAVLAIDPPR
jgi:predicted MFS family arabinose efflux permease